MTREIEQKYRMTEPAAVRERLRAVGADCADRVLEVNRLFDTPDGRLRRSGCGLRLRTWRSEDGARTGAGLTFKGPRVPGEFKVREELETVVASPQLMAEILARLGYREVLRFEKRRESWHLAGCTVTLDELPVLGEFVEIEGPSADAVAAARALLGLDGSPPVEETYPELAEREAQADETGLRRLVFPVGS